MLASACGESGLTFTHLALWNSGRAATSVNQEMKTWTSASLDTLDLIILESSFLIYDWPFDNFCPFYQILTILHHFTWYSRIHCDKVEHINKPIQQETRMTQSSIERSDLLSEVQRNFAGLKRSWADVRWDTGITGYHRQRQNSHFWFLPGFLCHHDLPIEGCFTCLFWAGAFTLGKKSPTLMEQDDTASRVYMN